MLGEEWHSCAPLAQGYDISNRGDVREFWRGDLRYVEPYVGPDEHLWVDLLVENAHYNYDQGRWDRQSESFRVWRLMLNSWFGNWQRGYMIHFLDGDKTNLNAENLRAMVIDSRGMERIIPTRYDGYYFVFDRRRTGNVEIVETGEVFEGVKAAANHIGGDHHNVSHVLAGRLKSHKGYHFRWV